MRDAAIFKITLSDRRKYAGEEVLSCVFVDARNALHASQQAEALFPHLDFIRAVPVDLIATEKRR